MLLEGLFIPVTTPFYADGRCNVYKLAQNVELYSKTPAAGLLIATEHGESSLLTDEETRQVLKTSIKAAAPEMVLVAGISHDSVIETVGRAEYAASLDYDAVCVSAPGILRGGTGDGELVGYFRMVADRSPLPVVLVSAEHKGLLELRTIVELARHPNIIGVVDSTTSVNDRISAITAGTSEVKRTVAVTTIFAAVTSRMKLRQESVVSSLLSASSLTGGASALSISSPIPSIKTRTKTVGFQILEGKTAGMLEGLRSGASGVSPAFAACAPQACYEVVAAWKDGDEGLAEEKQARLRPVASCIEERLGVPGLKFGCDLNGYFGGTVRPPLLPLTGKERLEVEELMRGTRS